MSSTLRNVPALDGIRALAISLVMLLHFRLFYDGWIGVQVFFVLSGFLITSILLDGRDVPFGTYLKRFFGRRFLRIFPLYYGFLLLLVLGLLLTGEPAELWGALPNLATYTYNLTRLSPDWSHSFFFTSFWSLCVEEQFYLVWPFLVYWLSRRGLQIALTCIILLGPVVRGGLGAAALSAGHDPITAGDFVYWFPLSHFDAFAIGGAIPVFGLAEKIPRPGSVLLGVLLVSGLCGLANLSSLQATGNSPPFFSVGYPGINMANYQHVWSYTLTNLVTAGLILALLDSDARSGRLARIFAARPVVSAGRVSYGMYVFHAATIILATQAAAWIGIRERALFTPWYFPVYFLAVYAMASLSYRYYEAPILGLKDRYFPRAR